MFSSSLSKKQLLKEIAELKKIIEELRKENALLKSKVAELEERLNKNSRNSSKPPSTDTPFEEKKKRAARRKKAQEKRAGATLEQVEEPDEKERLGVDCCSCCGEDLSGVEPCAVERRQEFDIPLVKVQVKEYQSEIQTRSFVINFDMKEHTDDCFIESEAIAGIKKHRDYILSALMKRTSETLALMRGGQRSRAMRLLNKTLGSHDKKRCNEYLSLMYLMMIAGDGAEVERNLESLNVNFTRQIESLNATGRETARESNPIATALGTLFTAWNNACESDSRRLLSEGKAARKEEFVQRYQVEPEEDGSLKELLGRDLFVALKRLSRDYDLSFPSRSVMQFARRFSNDLSTIREAGFEITVKTDRRGRKVYTVKRE